MTPKNLYFRGFGAQKTISSYSFDRIVAIWTTLMGVHIHLLGLVCVSLRNACHELNVEPELATVLSDHRLIEVNYFY